MGWENPLLNPIQMIQLAYPNLTEKQIRAQLADCGVKKDTVHQKIFSLSGGEQSKVKLCKLLLSPTNFLILDEPTNHLDADTKNELKQALIRFKGSIILVSHEESFYQEWADTIVSIDEIREGRLAPAAKGFQTLRKDWLLV